MIHTGSLNGLHAFVQVVEAGSFTEAAARLRLTKSAVGKSVSEMERRLGVRLLNRSTRSLSLTSEGRAYYEACSRALAEIDAAQALLASRRLAPSGRLRVDLPLSFGRRCVAPVLFEIAERYPELFLEISFNDRRVDLIEEGIDLAVRMGDLEDSSALVARKLYVQSSIVVASPDYLKRQGRPRDVDDLANHALIAYGRDGFTRPWLLVNAEGKQRSIVPRAQLVLGHGEPMLDAALAHRGLAYLPTWLAIDHLRSGALEIALSTPPVESAAVHALWPATRALTPKVRVVVDALVARFASGGWDTI
ncbi:LysR family transcriptional regulator [Terrarubrum flagellatum]|uniref:LysR family transcriptional regulator n=1 Tax=Terrirubrum flagellatum TaxID=2895980 RepID=UPI0031456F33